MTPAVPCPSCGSPLPAGGSAQCPACHLPLRGPLASRLWEVDQSLAALSGERQDLLTALRAQRDGTPVPTVPTPAAGHRIRTARRPRWSGQQVLLGVGVLLVLVAALVFLAVAWEVIGVGGQVLAMALLTGLTAYGALRLSRQGLRSSAEALAALTAGLLLVDVAAARALGLAGLEQVDLRGYTAVTATAVAVVLATLHARDRRVAFFGVGALVAATAAWAAVLGWTTERPALFAAVALVGAAVFASAAVRLPSRLGVVRSGAVVPAVLYLLLGLVVASAAAFDDLHRNGLTRSDAEAVLVLVALCGGGWALLRAVLTARGRGLDSGGATAAWLAAPLSWEWWPVSALAAAVGVAGPAAVTATGTQAGPTTTAAASVLVASGFSALATRPGARWSRTRWTVLAMAGLALVGLVTAADHWSSQRAATVAVAGVAVAATVLSVVRTDVRPVGSAVAALSGATSVGLAAQLLGDRWLIAALAVVALVLAALAAWRRGRPEELSLGVAALLTMTAAQVWALGNSWAGSLSLLLALEGAVATAYAVLLHRRYVVVVAALAWSGAVWVLAADSGVTTPEAYSVPAAAFALAAGLWLGSTTPQLSSWVTLGPAVALGLLPSALASVDDARLLRPLLTLVAAAAVLVVGVALRRQALVVVGAVAAGVVAVSQLAPYAVGLPRWLTLGMTGALLLALGARYERRRRDAVRAAHWLAHLR
jgi:hypothetical protein